MSLQLCLVVNFLKCLPFFPRFHWFHRFHPISQSYVHVLKTTTFKLCLKELRNSTRTWEHGYPEITQISHLNVLLLSYAIIFIVSLVNVTVVVSRPGAKLFNMYLTPPPLVSVHGRSRVTKRPPPMVEFRRNDSTRSTTTSTPYDVLVSRCRLFWPFRPSRSFSPGSLPWGVGSPAAPPEILHHTVWRTWLFIAYSDERWLYYQLLLPHKAGRMYFF